MKKHGIFEVVLAAVFAGLICASTMVVQIPVPATGGYVNLGDGVLLICAFLLQPLYAAAAAGVGSLLADLLAGYAAYAPGTMIIKAGMALLAALLYRRMMKSGKSGRMLPAMALAGVCAEMWMVLGYFFYEAVVLGMGAGAAGGILGNVGQGFAGIAVACVVSPVLVKNESIRNLTKAK